MPFFWIIIIFLADQLSKWYIVDELFDKSFFAADLFQTYTTKIYTITSWFNIVLVGNFGVSFGLLQANSSLMTGLLLGITIGIVVGIFIWLRRAQSQLQRFALSIILGGALGNILDRIRFNAVIDFIDLHYQNWHWPAFNIADSAIVMGVIILIFAPSKT